MVLGRTVTWRIDVVKLQEMHRKLVLKCPSKGLCLHKFKQFFRNPGQNEAAEYADSVFQYFDRNGMNLSYNEHSVWNYVWSLNTIATGFEHKLKWSFKVYDTTCLLVKVFTVVFQVMDENGDGNFYYFFLKLSLNEFIEGAQKDNWVLKMVQLDNRRKAR
uniref:Uncharacterized protein n=1 Tax=Chelydra serpentina TaxID=8475 RepID=A0A8C3TIW7_CHESE